MNDPASAAITKSLEGKVVYCKFLSANDSGQTGGHQSGILVSTTARKMLFDEDLTGKHILNHTASIKWQNEIETESTFTWYESKRELRITRFGRGFDLLTPERTGSLFVFIKVDHEYYEAYLLDSEEEINQYLDAFCISPTETNRIIDTKVIRPEYQEQLEVNRFLNSLTVDFPSSEEMSAAARNIYSRIHSSGSTENISPDQKLLRWTDTEYRLFRALESSRYGEIISHGFTDVDAFFATANQMLNRRKSRAGKSLEHHLAAIFDEYQLEYTAQPVTEGRKHPDFLFPSEAAYHNFSFPVENLLSLAAKTTCRDRWRQIINEADRLRNRDKYLCTLQQGISSSQMDEMEKERVILVVPKPYIASYPRDRQDRIWTLSRFISYVQELEGIP